LPPSIPSIESPTTPQTTTPELSTSLPPLDPSEDLMEAEIQLEMEQLDQQIAKQQETKKDVEQKISLLRARLNLPPMLAQQLVVLLRAVEDAKQRYSLLTGKKVSSDLAGSVDSNENNTLYRIIDRASLPRTPSWPNRRLYAAVGWAMALGLGLVGALIREFSNSTFADEEELSSQLKLPVLASIPTVIPAKNGNSGVHFGPALELTPHSTGTNGTPTFSLQTADSKIRHVICNPMTIAGEQYRMIRATLSIMQKQHGLKCLLIGSTIPG